MSAPYPERKFAMPQPREFQVKAAAEDGWPTDLDGVVQLLWEGRDPHNGNWLCGQPRIDAYNGREDIQAEVALTMALEFLTSYQRDYDEAWASQALHEASRQQLGENVVRLTQLARA